MLILVYYTFVKEGKNNNRNIVLIKINFKLATAKNVMSQQGKARLTKKPRGDRVSLQCDNL